MLLSRAFKDVKYVDMKVKTTVNGYIRECQQIFPQNDPFYTIPSLVTFTCILFYDEMEQFDIKRCSSDIKITDNNRTITMQGSGVWKTVFGKKNINPSSNVIIKYEFRINKLGWNNDPSVVIGIAQNADSFSTDGSISGLYGTFSIDLDGTQFCDSCSKQSTLKFVENDTLSMILNLSEKKLSFQKGHDQDYENQLITFFKSIPEYNYRGKKIIYRMFVELCIKDTGVTLVDVQTK